jgi:hypothetical protein
MPTRVHQPGAARLPRDLIVRWGEVPASVAADVLSGLTVIDPALRPLRPFAGRGRLIGSAVTALCEGTDYGAVHYAIAAAEAGDVLVIEAGGRNNPAVICELLGGAARLKGITRGRRERRGARQQPPRAMAGLCGIHALDHPAWALVHGARHRQPADRIGGRLRRAI